jgi:hypothetical protein
MRAPKQRTDNARKINQPIVLAIILPMDVGCGCGTGALVGVTVTGATVGGMTGADVGVGFSEGAREGGSVVFLLGAMDGGDTMEGAIDGGCTGAAVEGTTVGTTSEVTVSAILVAVDDDSSVATATRTVPLTNLIDFFMKLLRFVTKTLSRRRLLSLSQNCNNKDHNRAGFFLQSYE